MSVDEYVGIIGLLRFFWRFRCVKLRLYMETIGLISAFAFSMMMLITTILQWYAPNNEIIMVWNRYNEAFIEYILALISLPCMLYFFKKNLVRLTEREQHVSYVITEEDVDNVSRHFRLGE